MWTDWFSASILFVASVSPGLANDTDDWLALARSLRRQALTKTSPVITGPATDSIRSPSFSLFGPRYPWHRDIGTTIFWVGEMPSSGDPGNLRSAFDPNWLINSRHETAWYFALPYTDLIDSQRTKPEAASVVPWFRNSFVRQGQSVLRGRWIEIRHGGRTAYAQWADVGPFCTDHWQYVFGPERPRPNRNGNAGLDVSPAVRDWLGLNGIDSCDWRFVDRPALGPWLVPPRNLVSFVKAK